MFLILAASLVLQAEMNQYIQDMPLGDHQKGEIEIVVDRDKVEIIEKTHMERLRKKGLSIEEAINSSRTGIIAEDIYWIWQRDAVIFPTGAVGTYDRLLWKNSLKGPAGVAVLPILPDGKIALNINFRHATRCWELEVPRGLIHKGEHQEDTARREVEEETGLIVDKLVSLGEMAPDTGVLNSVVPVYAGYVKGEGKSSQEESEAIAGIQAFTVDELEKGIKKGFLEIAPHGKVYIRDSFLTFALFQIKTETQAMLNRPKVGVGVIVRDGDHILIGKRKNAHGSGTWALPGGHLEFKETPEECAARELLEETGLRALSVKKGVWTNDVIDGSKHYITLFMIVDRFEGKLETKEPEKCEGWEWHRYENLPKPLFPSIESLLEQNPDLF